MSQDQRYQQLVERVKALRGTLASKMYELGLLMKQVQEKELWKLGGHATFVAFCQCSEVGVRKSTAYDLIRVVEAVDKETFLAVGLTKLRIVLSVEGQAREELLEVAKGGASARALSKLVGRKGQEDVQQRVKDLERALRSAFNPHAAKCLGMLDKKRCTCGVVALTKAKR